MKRSSVLALTLAVAVPSAALACEGKYRQQASAGPRSVTVAQVSSWTARKAATPVDANDADTRLKEGVIPGAIMLTSASRYDVRSLPEDRSARLVFYCYNDMCRASEMAATKAMAAGYTDVSVLKAGIMGWKASGGQVSKPNS